MKLLRPTAKKPETLCALPADSGESNTPPSEAVVEQWPGRT